MNKILHFFRSAGRRRYIILGFLTGIMALSAFAAVYAALILALSIAVYRYVGGIPVDWLDFYNTHFPFPVIHHFVRNIPHVKIICLLYLYCIITFSADARQQKQTTCISIFRVRTYGATEAAV